MKMKKYGATGNIIIACFVCFVLQLLIGDFTGMFAASVNDSKQVWRLFTYMFVHGGIIHLLCNMMCLYSFGRNVEKKLGVRKYLLLYAFSGLVSAVVALIIMSFKGGGSMVGASGAILGVLYYFVKANPNAMMIVIFFPCRAKNLLKGLIALSIFCLIFNLLPGISHGGHLGGLLGGWIFSKIKPLTKKEKILYDWRERGKPRNLDLDPL